jgi:hypothetical protein
MFGPHRPGDKRYLGPETAPSSRFQARTPDDRGQPLRCTKLMTRPAEAAAKGVKGEVTRRRYAVAGRIGAGTRRLPGKEPKILDLRRLCRVRTDSPSVARPTKLRESRETEFRAQRQLGRKRLLGIIWSLQRLEPKRQSPPIRGYLPAARKSPRSRDCVVGPGVVPRHGDFNNLDCQTGLTGVTGAKGIFRCCQISRAMICPIGSGTNAARSNLLTESN